MLVIDISKCTGCRRCEVACAFSHTGRINNHLSRIKILNLYEIGIDGPVVCVQCAERYCMKCPVNALTIGPLGQMIVSPTVCTLCGACEKNCPIGAIEQFNDIVYVCDLCGGRPKCVAACTEGALLCQASGVQKSALRNKGEREQARNQPPRQEYKQAPLRSHEKTGQQEPAAEDNRRYISLQQIKAATKGMTPAQRRYFYLARQSKEIREQWEARSA